MKVLSHVAAVVLLVLAVSAAMLVPGDGAAFSDKPPRDSFPPLGTKTVLVTAPLAGQGNRVIFCTLANATSQPVTVTIAGYSSDGTHHIPLGPFVLNPHTADGTFFTPDTGFGYCAFALSSGADSVRAHAQLYDETETTSVFQGSSEAR